MVDKEEEISNNKKQNIGQNNQRSLETGTIEDTFEVTHESNQKPKKKNTLEISIKDGNSKKKKGNKLIKTKLTKTYTNL